MVWRDMEITRMAFFYIYSVNKAIEILIDIETINAAFEPVPEDTCESDVTLNFFVNLAICNTVIVGKPHK